MTTDSKPRRTIVWRPEQSSFLEPLDLHALRSLVRRELGRHLRGLRKGTILEPQEFWDRFMIEARNDQGHKCWIPSPASKGFLRSYDSLALIDERLCEQCGSWFPWSLCESALRPILHPRPGSGSTTPPNRNHAVEVVIERLIELHRSTDHYLQRLYEHFDLHAIESIDDELSAIHRWIAADMGRHSRHEDRWFGEMGHWTCIFLESVGCRVAMEQIDALAETHFRSWVEPQSDQLTQFADDVAVLALERLFAERYGDIEPDDDAP